MRPLFVVPWLALLVLACDPPRAPFALISKTGPARGDAGTRIVRADGGSQGIDASPGFDGGVVREAGQPNDAALPIVDSSGEIDTTAPFPDSGAGDFGDAAGL